MSATPSVPGTEPTRPSIRQPRRRHSPLRRRLFELAARASGALGGRALYRRAFLARGRVRVREERVAVPGLPAGLEGLRIAQLSDLHGGRFMGAGDLAEVVEEVNRLDPDLVVVTGDWITEHWSEALPLLDDLVRLRTRYGVLGVFGNHDYRDRAEGRIAEAGRARGIEFLRDGCRRIDTGSGVLAVVGLEDLEEARELEPGAARNAVREGDVELVLCHNPAGAPALARRGCCCVLSGHTHGGQLRFLQHLGPPHPGLRLELGPTALIVSRGLGIVGFPWRSGAPTEIVLVRLETSRS